MCETQQRSNILTTEIVTAAVETSQGSKTFVKKVVSIAIAFIVYQRTNFDKHDFLTGTHNGITYKMFKKNMRNLLFKSVRTWIHGALDALEKNYLREMYLIFCDQEDNTVYESYKFQFKYTDNDVISSELPPPKQTLAEVTDTLLKAISTLDQHRLFEENEFNINMALTYYDNVTPSDYEPPFYDHYTSAEELLKRLSKHSDHYLQLGFFRTGFHTMKCRGKGEIFNINHSSSTITPLEKSITDTKEINTDASVSSLSVLSLNDSSASTNEIRCICEISMKFKNLDLVMCAECSCLQHSACMGYLHSSDISDEYVCHQCKFGTDSFTDDENRKQLTSIYRLVVADAYFNKKVPNGILNQLSSEIRSLILKKLKTCDIISTKDSKQVNVKHIEATCLKGLFLNSSFVKANTLPASMTLDDSDEQNKNNLAPEGVPNKKRKYK